MVEPWSQVPGKQISREESLTATFLHAMGQGSDQMGELLGRRRLRRRHLETQVDIQARKLLLSLLL